jgi:hypothetical protein
MNQYNGFNLFNDIEDIDLRTRNRAVVLANIFQDNSKNLKMTPKGASVFLNYFKLIPDEEKQRVETKFRECMKERGFKETY